MKNKQIKETNNTKACYRTIIIISVVFGLIITICFGIFFNYSAKLNKEGIEITKLNHRTEKLEKKNGSEQKQIDDLKKEIKRLEEIISRRN